MTCKHKYVDMEDGSRDKFCIICSNKFKQAVAALPLSEIKIELNLPHPNSYLMPPTLVSGGNITSKLTFTAEAIELLNNVIQKNKKVTMP
jgi:hypothetical protein